jgi:hypothetical protein
MLMPADEKLLAALSGIYDLATTPRMYPEDGYQNEEVLRRLSLALVDYRRGNYTLATARCGSCLSQRLNYPLHLSQVLAISAMSQHQLHQDDEARLELAFARRIVDPVIQKGPSPFSGSIERSQVGNWIVCMEVQTLLREASTLIGDLPASINSRLDEAKAALDEVEHLCGNSKFRNAGQAQYDEAEKLINQVPALAVQVEGKKAAEVFIVLGQWRLQRREWREAAAQWRTVIYGPENRGSLLTMTNLSSFYLSYAPLLVAMGDTNAYEQFRVQAITTFSGTGLALNAERTLTSCLLLPADTNLIGALRKLASVITSATNAPVAGWVPDWVPWGDSALALFEYRKHNPARTLQLAQKNLGASNLASALTARFQVLKALAMIGLNQRDGAQTELNECRETIKTNFEAADPDDLGNWRDWCIDHLLLQEAALTVGAINANITNGSLVASHGFDSSDGMDGRTPLPETASQRGTEAPAIHGKDAPGDP